MKKAEAHRGRRAAGVLAALAVVALLGIGVWWAGRGSATAPPGSAPSTPASPPASAGRGALAASPVVASPGPVAPAAAPAGAAGLAPAAPPTPSADPGEQARPEAPPPEQLPPTTQPLAEEFRPGTTDWDEAPMDDKQEVLLRILPVRYNVVVPQPIVILLESIDRSGQRRPLDRPEVRIRPLDRPDAQWITAPARDDGGGGDETAGDLRYAASFQPDAGARKALLGRLLVEGSATAPSGARRAVPAVLLYTAGPRARLTGHWRDGLRAGHLWLDAELEVEEAGLFTVIAQLFGPSLQPIAWVKQTAHLDAGRGTLTLQVFGKAIRDAGIDGPYRVRQVMLTRDYLNSGDYDPGPTIEEAHRTRPYRAAEFSAEPWQPPPQPAGDQVDATHPSQQGKPPPERSRTVTPG